MSTEEYKMKIVLAAVPWSSMVNVYPPLGLGYLAGAVKEDPCLPVRLEVMDFGLHPHMTPDEAVAQMFETGPPDLLGLSCLTNNFQASLELAVLAKKAHPALKTVFGGPHPSVDPESVAACPGVDAVVFGEGEITFKALVARFLEGGWAEELPGCAWADQGTVKVNPPRPLIQDLDALPFPARKLMEIEKYRFHGDDGQPIYTLLTSRGCPYACTYCFKGVFGSKYRTRSVENVMAEIRWLIRNYQARHLYFGDDIFMLEEDRVRGICQAMGTEKMDLTWSCLARVDRVTPFLLQAMKEAGCVQIHYGIESGSPEILERIRKKIDLEAVKRAVRWTREAGIRTKGYFMAGLPGDTEETLAQTLRFARTLPLDEVMLSLATPFPGTALWDEQVKREGKPDLEDFNRAYYFDDGAGKVRAFFNLSQVETKKLEAMVGRAQAYFRRRKDQGAFRRRYGPVLGPLAHMAYRLVGSRKETAKVKS